MKMLRKITASMLCFIIFFILSGCCLYYHLGEINGIDVGYSKLENNAFIAHVLWNKGESLEIKLPDDYNGIKIKELGGYFGRGVPRPFTMDIDLGNTYQEYNVHYYTDEKILYEEDLDWWDEYEIINYDFEVTLPSYLAKITYISMSILIYEKNVEEKTVAIVIRPTYFFKISEDNNIFYTLDGKLYDKKTDELLTGFTYRN